EERKDLATLLEEAIAPSTAIVDWSTKEDVQREMRQRIKKLLRVAKYAEGDGAKVEETTAKLMELARARRGR
ncbi:type I restriction enzyme endonuclease domain-containing protein, partial [Hyalangium sp.]|uniref:type I restriction enzyme endonuclease domain-containing protein n=1 Tax=Hyalangium sp. TaxID=2028555 RepID=UPI002D23A87A